MQIISIIFVAFICFFGEIIAARTFSVDYQNHQFLLDGQPFRYISGSIHYMRVHPYYWNDRLMRIRALGFNAVTVYVPWNLHEPREGIFDFSGAQNLTQFIQLAQQNQLYVLLRPGPYICAEWENGGFPYWLLKYPPFINLRTNDPIYLNKTAVYFNVLLDIVKPLLYQNGGPILMVQVENEYGNTGVCNGPYKEFLRDLIWSKLGNDTVLYTTNANNGGSLQCGDVAGVYPTIDFGPTGNDQDIINSFKTQDQYNGGGPHVCSEFWVYGCFYKWFQSQPCDLPTNAVISNLMTMYAQNASFNIYMIHGGTNFGFMNGGDNIPTTYDYAAAIAENGDITDTYLAIRSMIQNFTGWPQPPLEIPANNPATAYGQVTLKPIGSNILSTITVLQEPCKASDYPPLDFEAGLDLDYGYALYTTTLTNQGKNLSMQNIMDFGYVYLNNIYQGLLYKCDTCDNNVFNTSIIINAKPGDILRVLVENKGRDNVGFKVTSGSPDRKGIHDYGALDGVLIKNWVQCAINLTKASIDSLTSNYFQDYTSEKNPIPEKAAMSPGFYVGQFSVDSPQDTFLDTTGWGKGQLFINGYNLGRYWPLAGPQMTLYVPKPYIQQTNTILMIELLGAQRNNVEFVDHAIFSYH